MPKEQDTNPGYVASLSNAPQAEKRAYVSRLINGKKALVWETVTEVGKFIAVDGDQVSFGRQRDHTRPKTRN